MDVVGIVEKLEPTLDVLCVTEPKNLTNFAPVQNDIAWRSLLHLSLSILVIENSLTGVIVPRNGEKLCYKLVTSVRSRNLFEPVGHVASQRATPKPLYPKPKELGFTGFFYNQYKIDLALKQDLIPKSRSYCWTITIPLLI